jgi:hypothetical protein
VRGVPGSGQRKKKEDEDEVVRSRREYEKENISD